MLRSLFRQVGPHPHRRLTSKIATLLLVALSVLVVPSVAFAQDDDAKRLKDDALDNDYLNTKFDDAIAKLNKAVKLCGKKCSKKMRGELHIALAVVYGAGKGDLKTAKGEMEKAFKADKNAKPLELYFNEDVKKIYAEAKKNAAAGDDDDDDSGTPPPKKPPPPKGDDDDDDSGKPKKPPPKKPPPPKGDDDDDDSGKPKKPPPPKGDDDDDDSGKPKKPPKKPPKGDDDDDSGTSGSVSWKAPEEALVNTPLPIFIPTEEGADIDSATLHYQPFGETKWLKVTMKHMDNGFGGLIPCAQITTTGKLKLYIFLKDKSGELVAQAGARKTPLEVTIKNEMDGEQPSFPGDKPPKKCQTVECPPDFPGCSEKHSGEGHGTIGWGGTCNKTEECKEGLSCVNGSCEQGGSDLPPPDGSTGKPEPGDGFPLKKHMISLTGGPEFLFLSSSQDVCGGTDPGTDGKFGTKDDSLSAPTNYFCFRAAEDGGGEYLGKPAAGRFNEIQGGGALAGGRLMLGYDFRYWKGLAAGIRVGVAFGGSPKIGDSPDRFSACDAGNPFGKGKTDADGNFAGFCRAPSANNFMPAHVELQVLKVFPMEFFKVKSKYWPRPYGYVGFGIVGQVNAGVQVAVCDSVDAKGNPVSNSGDGRCPANTVKRENVTAYQITGLNFVPVGIGTLLPVHQNFGFSVELKTMFLLPTFGAAISPVFGAVGMF